jgi:hypothetical protein
MRASALQDLEEASLVGGRDQDVTTTLPVPDVQSIQRAGRAGERIARWLDGVDLVERDLEAKGAAAGLNSVEADGVCRVVEDPQHQRGPGEKREENQEPEWNRGGAGELSQASAHPENASQPDHEGDPRIALRRKGGGCAQLGLHGTGTLAGGARRTGRSAAKERRPPQATTASRARRRKPPGGRSPSKATGMDPGVRSSAASAC